MSLRDDILRRINVREEFEKYGVKIPDRATPNPKGWISCHSLYGKDNHPSAAINIGDGHQRGLYHDFILGLNKSIFDIVAEAPGSGFMTGKDAFYHYARVTGLMNRDKGDKNFDHPGPTLIDIETFQKNLSPETIRFLKEKRGLTEESIGKYRIGWCTKRERNAFPVFDESNTLCNVRFHNSKKKPKTINWTGYGEARLWGLERLAKAAPGTIIIITEGEFDAMLAEQETGMIAVSSTNGVTAFKKDWVRHFHGFHVVLLFDADQEGRAGVETLVLPAFETAIKGGQVLSIKVVWLYPGPAEKDHKDLTDWIIKDGGSGARLKELIAKTDRYIFPEPINRLEPPIPLEGFEQIDRAEYAGRRVTVPLQVFGENTVAYHTVTKLRVTSCPALRDGKCTGPTKEDGKTLIHSCVKEIEVPLGERVMVASVRATEGQLRNHLRDFVCDRDRRPALSYKDEDRLTIREVYAHQVVGAMAAERIELVEKPVYIIGGGLVEIGKYQAIGRVVTSYRDQQPTMLVNKLERQEEDYQAFNLEKVRPHLEKLQELEPRQIVEDISRHMTKIYERIDIHLGNILVLLSPLEIDFPGEGRIRGRLSAINVGETGTGKTTIVAKLCDAARVGQQVSGMTASRTGITYGCEHDERRGWRIKAGAFLKMNRQILIVDEAQDLKSEDLKTVAEGFDTGLTRIDRIQNKVFESKTRVIFNCNPRHPKKAWEQRTMDSFRYGCQAIQGVFAQMMIRRIDMVLFSTAWDVDKEKIFLSCIQR
jgi:hypothetical protein